MNRQRHRSWGQQRWEAATAGTCGKCGQIIQKVRPSMFWSRGWTEMAKARSGQIMHHGILHVKVLGSILGSHEHSMEKSIPKWCPPVVYQAYIQSRITSRISNVNGFRCQFVMFSVHVAFRIFRTPDSWPFADTLLYPCWTSTPWFGSWALSSALRTFRGWISILRIWCQE